MIKEALEFFHGLSVNAARPQPVDLGDPRSVALVVGGEVKSFGREPAPRSHKAGTLDDIIALAVRFGDHHDDDDEPVVWYGPAKVVLVIDDEGHRLETATLDLAVSSAFATVKHLASKAGGIPYDHKPFLRLLRIDLAGCLASSELYDRVKKVTFDNGLVVDRSVARNKAESLGSNIRSSVSGEGDIPDEVALTVPVYSTPGERERFGLRCAVEVDPAEGKFRLVPLPDEVERVEALAVASIGQRLASLPCPAYFGNP